VLLDMNHGKKEIAEQRTGVHFRTIQLIADRDAYEYENQNENENQQEIITFDNNYQQVMEIEEDSRKIEWEEV
ncbi:MAG: hypothetical protein IKJ01_00325, partial [Lachnospiraceae bacterium]|nr:hypothetical protein [Lachnospiraceae bacterium]